MFGGFEWRSKNCVWIKRPVAEDLGPHLSSMLRDSKRSHRPYFARCRCLKRQSYCVCLKRWHVKSESFLQFLGYFSTVRFFFHVGIHFPEWCARIWSNTNFNLLEFWFPLISCTIDISLWCSHSTALLIYKTKREKLHWQNTIMKWKPVWNNSCRTFTITSETIGTLLVREFSGDFLLSRRKAGADVLVSATQQQCRWSITSW